MFESNFEEKSLCVVNTGVSSQIRSVEKCPSTSLPRMTTVQMSRSSICQTPILKFHHFASDSSSFCQTPVLKFHHFASDSSSFCQTPILKFHNFASDSSSFCQTPILKFNHFASYSSSFCQTHILNSIILLVIPLPSVRHPF